MLAGRPRVDPASWSYHPALRTEVTHRSSTGGTTCSFVPKESHDLPVSDSSPGTDHWDMSRGYPSVLDTKPNQSDYIRMRGINPADRAAPAVGMAGIFGGAAHDKLSLPAGGRTGRARGNRLAGPHFAPTASPDTRLCGCGPRRGCPSVRVPSSSSGLSKPAEMLDLLEPSDRYLRDQAAGLLG
jgi:hypothetical protein